MNNRKINYERNRRMSISVERILKFLEEECINMDDERKKARRRRRKSKKRINTLKKQKEFREWNHKRWLSTVKKIPKLLDFETEMRRKYINTNGYPNLDEQNKLIELDRAKKFNESYVKWQRHIKSNEIENGENYSESSLCNEITNGRIDYNSDSISSLSD